MSQAVQAGHGQGEQTSARAWCSDWVIGAEAVDDVRDYILLIPGTSPIGHLRENLAATDLELPNDAVALLNCIAAGRAPA